MMIPFICSFLWTTGTATETSTQGNGHRDKRVRHLVWCRAWLMIVLLLFLQKQNLANDIAKPSAKRKGCQGRSWLDVYSLVGRWVGRKPSTHTHEYMRFPEMIYSWVWVDGIHLLIISSFYSSRWDLKLWSGGLKIISKWLSCFESHFQKWCNVSSHSAEYHVYHNTNSIFISGWG